LQEFTITCILLCFDVLPCNLFGLQTTNFAKIFSYIVLSLDVLACNICGT
jgi:hypothetical protein